MAKIIEIKTQEDMEDLVENQVYKTNNYDLLKLSPYNRDVRPVRVARLKRSVRAKNILSRRPIEINKDFEVVDGQTRLAVARDMLIPIYFTYAPDAEIEDIRVFNYYVDKWATSAFMEHYLKLNKKEYVMLNDFANEYRLSVPISMQLLSNKSLKAHDEWQKIRERFQNGTFIIEDYKHAEKVASLISEVRNYSPDFAWTMRDCIRAIWIVVDTIDPKLLTNALSKYNQIVTRRYSVADYLKQFENIISAGGKQVKLTD